MRDRFNFYLSYRETIKHLPPEQRLSIYEAIMDYSFYGKDVSSELEPTCKMVFGLIKPTLVKSNTLSNNGKKGGAPKGNTNAKKTK